MSPHLEISWCLLACPMSSAHRPAHLILHHYSLPNPMMHSFNINHAAKLAEARLAAVMTGLDDPNCVTLPGTCIKWKHTMVFKTVKPYDAWLICRLRKKDFNEQQNQQSDQVWLYDKHFSHYFSHLHYLPKPTLETTRLTPFSLKREEGWSLLHITAAATNFYASPEKP